MGYQSAWVYVTEMTRGLLVCIVLAVPLLSGCVHEPWGPTAKDISVDDNCTRVRVQVGYNTRIGWNEGEPNSGTITDEYEFTYRLNADGPWAKIESISPKKITDQRFEYLYLAYGYPDELALAALSKIPHPNLPEHFYPRLTKTLGNTTLVLAGEDYTKGKRWLMLDSKGGRHMTALTTDARVCRWDPPQHRVIFMGGAAAVGSAEKSRVMSPESRPQATAIFYIWDYEADALSGKGFDIRGDFDRYQQQTRH